MDWLSNKMLQGAGQHGPLVLMYHSVTDGRRPPAWTWAVSHGNFCRQMDLLCDAGWKSLRLQDLQLQENIKPKTIIITFDDGYLDNYKAYQELINRGMCASWYIVSRDIGGVAGWRDAGAPVQPMLEADQLYEMYKNGMEIGAHSRTHARLCSLDDAALEDEVAGSRRDLLEKTGCPVETFAYPYGDLDDRVVEAVRKAGYKVACCTRSGWAMRDTDLLRIKRLAVYAKDDLGTFARKLAFADNEASWGKLTRYAIDRVVSRITKR